LIQAGQFGDAVYLWQTVARQELEQGQASGVLAMFRHALREESLEIKIKDVLYLFCANLERFLGNIEQAGNDVNSISQADSLFVVAGLEMKGKIENDRSQYTKAQRSFEAAIERANILLEARIAHIHKGMAWMHLRQRDFDQVELELTLAQFEIENMRGNLAYDRCLYDSAAVHYGNALALAREIDSRDAIAKSTHNLATTYMIRGQFGACIDSLQQVYRHYEGMNRVAAMAGCRITMAVACNLAGRYQDALGYLEEALKHLATLAKATAWQYALIDQAQAEALLGLGELSTAVVHVENAIAAGDTGILPDAYRTYGEILMHQREWQAAEKYLLKSIDLADQNEDILLLAYGRRALGKFYLMQQQFASAQRAIAEAISLFQSVRLLNEVNACEQLLSEFPEMAKFIVSQGLS